VTTTKKGMGIKTSVKSGNFRATKSGAGMTQKACRHIAVLTQVAGYKPQSRRRPRARTAQSVALRIALDQKGR